MYINNHQLAEQLWAQYTDEVIKNLNIIQSLLRKYWKKIKSDSIHVLLEKDYPNIVSLIKFLWKVNKLNIKDVTSITNLIKNTFDHTTTFDVRSSATNTDEVSTYLESTHNAKTNTQVSDKIGVRIQWEWLYYERNLDKDLSKLLK